MGGVYQTTGRPAEALEKFEEALPIMRQVGDRAGEATTLSNIATSLVQLERAQEAITQLELAISVMRETGLILTLQVNPCRSTKQSWKG